MCKNLIAILAAVVLTVPARATTQRTFVSRSGLDTNSCAADQPCRSFGAAMLQTNANAEVVVIDSGGYGVLTITKSVAIIAPLGVHAGVSVFGGNGVTVSAAATDVVVLRNLYINSQGGSTGIALGQAKELYVQHCVVTGFSGNGIDVSGALSGVEWVFIDDSEIRDNGASGIYAGPRGGNVVLDVDHTRLENNGYGLAIDSGVRLTVTNSRAAKNHYHGFFIRSGGALAGAYAKIDNCVSEYAEFEGGAGGNGSAFLLQNNGSALITNSIASHGPFAFRIDSSGDNARLTAIRSSAYRQLTM